MWVECKLYQKNMCYNFSIKNAIFHDILVPLPKYTLPSFILLILNIVQKWKSRERKSQPNPYLIPVYIIY